MKHHPFHTAFTVFYGRSLYLLPFAMLFLFWNIAQSSPPRLLPTTRPNHTNLPKHRPNHTSLPKHNPSHKKLAPTTPTGTHRPQSRTVTQQASSVLAGLFKGDDEFLRTHPSPYFQRFCNEQTPEITLVMCSDSRVHETLFNSDPNNHIFTVRNIGNQMMTAMGSVDYGILHLKTPLLVIMGHTHCGAIHAAINPYEGEPLPIIRELDHLFSPLKPLLRKKGKLPPNELWTQGVAQNVDYQVQIATRRYQKQIRSKKLYVLGMIDDIANIYGHGFGRVVLVNINGETRLQALRQHPLVRHYPESTKRFHIYRPIVSTTPTHAHTTTHTHAHPHAHPTTHPDAVPHKTHK